MISHIPPAPLSGVPCCIDYDHCTSDQKCVYGEGCVDAATTTTTRRPFDNVPDDPIDDSRWCGGYRPVQCPSHDGCIYCCRSRTDCASHTANPNCVAL